MAVNFLKRYIWLIDLINRRGYISFREISEAWSRSPLNDSGSALSERTFFNHKTAIEEMLGIEIKNDRTMGYYIRGEEVGDNATLNWMLHSLCMNNLFQENSDMKDRILVENVPSSEKFLSDIISAMRSGRVIQISYKSFYRPEATFFFHRAVLRKTLQAKVVRSGKIGARTEDIRIGPYRGHGGTRRAVYLTEKVRP